MFCTKCGAELEDGAKFCTACGQPTDDQAVPAAPATAPEAPAAKESKDAVGDFLAKAKLFFASAWIKTKELASNIDKKLADVLGAKKLYAYAGVIALIGIIIVISVIAALIPESNGYLTYDSAIRLMSQDDTVYMLKNGKATAIKTDAETVDSTKSSIDGKVTVFVSNGELFLLKGKKAELIAENVGDYTLSLYGDAVVYTEVEGLNITYYYRKLSSGKSIKLHENELASSLLSYAIAPDGKSVSYFISDGLTDRALFYFNGKEATELDDCYGRVIGMSNGGKYIYVEVVKDLKTYLYAYNKKGDGTKIDSCNAGGFALNLSATEIMYTGNDKTYISTKGKEPIKAASAIIELVKPAYTSTFKLSADCVVYPVESLYEHVYSSGSTAYYVSKRESKNIKLVKADSWDFRLDNSAEFLYYFDDDELKVLEIAKGERADDKAKTIAKDVEEYVLTSDRKYVYYLSDAELHVVNGKKGGKSKELQTDDVSDILAIDKNDAVYFLSDGDVYAATGKKKGKLVLDDGYSSSLGGYVYLTDGDTLYAARGRSKPKALIELD